VIFEMAELNELLQQAVSEAEGLSLEAAHAQETVERLLRQASALEMTVDAGLSETRLRLEALSVRLNEAEAELAQEGANTRASLQVVETSSGEVRERVLEFLHEARADLGALRAERDELRAEVEQRGEQASEGIERAGLRVRELEAAAEARLLQAKQEIAAFRGLVDDGRAAVTERRNALLIHMRQLEEGARARLEYVSQTYDTMARTVQEQASEVQAALKSLSEQVAAGAARRLGHDAIEALQRSCEPLRDAIGELDSFGRKTRQECDKRIDGIADQVEKVTAVLERLRRPLDLVKEHLR
jgi:archaellum component FlaC